MKSILSRIIIAISLLSCPVHLAANPNVINVKGTVSILKPAYQKLSLAYGCVWYKLPICENLYRIAKEKKGKEATPIDDLVQELFHLYNDQIDFRPSTKLNKMSIYLTPESVGQLVGLLYQLAQKGRPWAGACQDDMKKVLEKLMPNEWRNLSNLNKRFDELKANQEAIQKKLKSQITSKQKTALKQEKEQLNFAIQELQRQLYALPSADEPEKFSKILIDAHLICQEKKSLYLSETVYCMLLANIWGKANTRKELVGYYDGLKMLLGEEIFVEAVDRSAWIGDVFSFDYAKKIFAQANRSDGKPVQSMSFEELVLVTFAQHEVLSIAPPVFGKKNVDYVGYMFTDCVETVLRNIGNFLCYDAESKKFDISVFEKLKGAKPECSEKIDQIINFYKSIENEAVEFDSGSLRNQWTKIVSGLPGVTYANAKKQCEITVGTGGEEGYNNFERAIKALTCCNTLQELSTYAKNKLVFNKFDKGHIQFHYSDTQGGHCSGAIGIGMTHMWFVIHDVVENKIYEKIATIEENDFGRVACLSHLVIRPKYNRTIWNDIVEPRMRRYCCLVGKLKEQKERNLLLSLLDSKDPLKEFILLAAHRQVADSYRNQKEFFTDVFDMFGVDVLSLFTHTTPSNAATGAIISKIMGQEESVRTQFKTVIDTLPNIKDDSVKVDVIKDIIRDKKNKDLIDRVLPSLHNENSQADIIAFMFSSGYYEFFSGWIEKTIGTLKYDEAKGTVIASIINPKIGNQFAKWVDEQLPNIHSDNAIRKIILSMMGQELVTFIDTRTAWINQKLTTIKDDNVAYSILKMMSLFPDWREQFSDAIKQKISTMHNKDQADELRGIFG